MFCFKSHRECASKGIFKIGLYSSYGLHYCMTFLLTV